MRKYKAIGIHDLSRIPQLSLLNANLLEEIKTVSELYPFRTNEYILDELISWENFSEDPMYRLNFPTKDMLEKETYSEIVNGSQNLAKEDFKKLIRKIRLGLNPHPGYQMDLNVPFLSDVPLQGLQHKYDNIVLFFPNQGQTCHAYCTFCFRWAQFVGEPDFKIRTGEVTLLINYLTSNPQVTDLLITGGDPMIMNAKLLEFYILPLLSIKTLKCIRIGSKSLSFWPYKYFDDEDAGRILDLFRKIVQSGKHLSFMAHFNHPVELKTNAVKEAINKIKSTGAQIRTQSPLLKHINNSPAIWAELWEMQIQLGCIPYYMFLARDTGAQNYFAIPLNEALNIFKDAVRTVSGLSRTVRGPIMSTKNGKVEILDYWVKKNVYVLRYIRHRNQQLTYNCFYGKPKTPVPIWLDDLEPLSSDESVYFM